MVSRPMVMTSSTLWSPTTWRITASDMSRKVEVGSRTSKRYFFGSLILYCTTHSTTATLRSPVSMADSAAVSGVGAANSLLIPARCVRKPNSSFSVRCTGTFVTESTNGTFTCGPGFEVPT